MTRCQLVLRIDYIRPPEGMLESTIPYCLTWRVLTIGGFALTMCWRRLGIFWAQQCPRSNTATQGGASHNQQKSVRSRFDTHQATDAPTL